MNGGRRKMRKLSVWELSRLGRNTLEVLKTIEEFNTLEISLFIKNYNIETLNEDGKPNVMSAQPTNPVGRVYGC